MNDTRAKVLIVDDNPTIRDLYKTRLEQSGYEVLLATNGDEGIEIALSQKPAAILLDLMMPVRGGLGVLDVLKTQPNTKDIPVIILTAYPVDEYQQKSSRAGAAFFLSKAETMPGDVVKRVEEVIANSK